jgi:hypothetical protein
MSAITIKAGDTFSLPMTWESGGAPVDLTGYAIASQVRRRSDTSAETPVDELTCEADADQATNPGQFVVSATATMTASWPVAVLDCDVRFTSASGVVHTDTFEIQVARAITR